MKHFLFAAGLLLSLSLAGCGNDADPPGDAAVGADSGGSIDSGPRPDDASTPVDASLRADVVTPLDAGNHEHDAGDPPPDAATDEDSGIVDGEDACVPPPCPAPPDRCHYEGASLCACGTLVCEPAAPCDPPCGAGEYCNLCTETATCLPRPDRIGGVACTADYRPVCGCDGETYSNACELGLAMIDFMHGGECDGDGGGSF
jgi:hypothetical protein